MNFLVRRRWIDPRSVTGELLLDGKLECYTLEPPKKTDGSKPRAIPAGTYPLTVRFSDKFHRLMPHVENVPGFDAIEIHWGNFPKDTEGCTLVGSIHENDFVGHSVAEFAKLFVLIQSACEAAPQQITYVDPPLSQVPDLDGEISV
jgi:hypothetical protein